jgi:D-alanyl-D-alanine carboxypeptidase (penicillin-binding protein 5/6)
VSKAGKKTGIKLPSATTGGNYKSSSAASVKTIEGITCEAAVLVEVGSNTSVAEKNADSAVHPASLTKVMTLLVACENAKDPNKLLTVKQDMLDRRTELDGSGELVDNTSVLDANDDLIQIQIVGKSVTVEDALYLINYQSDTVACLLMAEYVAGSEEAFVAMMNAKAREIGLTNTTFVNCTGLTEKSGEYNKTTAREMAAILACALENSVAKKIISATDKYTVNVYENGKKTEYKIPFFADWYNREARLNGNTKAGKVTIKGGKTGYEDIPTSCFITYGTSASSGKTYVCVVIGKLLGSSSKGINNAGGTADMRTVYSKYAD